MPFLILIGGDKRNIIHRVREDGCLIGRGFTGTVHVDLGHDLSVSRRDKEARRAAHAEVFNDDEFGWSIRDLGSENGTIVVSAESGRASILPHETAMSTGGACLFQVGASAILFLGLDEPPSDRLVEDLSRDHEQTVRLSVEASHAREGRDKSTEDGGPAEAHDAALAALWQHVREVLRSDGLADLLP